MPPSPVEYQRPGSPSSSETMVDLPHVAIADGIRPPPPRPPDPRPGLPGRPDRHFSAIGPWTSSAPAFRPGCGTGWPRSGPDAATGIRRLCSSAGRTRAGLSRPLTLTHAALLRAIARRQPLEDGRLRRGRAGVAVLPDAGGVPGGRYGRRRAAAVPPAPPGLLGRRVTLRPPSRCWPTAGAACARSSTCGSGPRSPSPRAASSSSSSTRGSVEASMTAHRPPDRQLAGHGGRGEADCLGGERGGAYFALSRSITSLVMSRLWSCQMNGRVMTSLTKSVPVWH